MMNRRHFAMTLLGVGAGALSASSQARAVVQPGSLKQRVHARQAIRIASAPTNSDRRELEEILKRGTNGVMTD